jgi:hypothetical protein
VVHRKNGRNLLSDSVDMLSFKEYLNEINKVYPFTLQPASSIAKTDKKLKPLPGGSDLFWLSEKRGDTLVIVIYADTKKEELVEAGFLELTNRYPTDYPVPVRVASLIHVNPELRGRGMAKSLYGIAMSILGFNIAADNL